jgi:flagellar hook-associated protein 3 FlgL
MRVSSSTIFDSNIASLGQQQTRLLQTQQQISTGRRILTAADDPVAATRALDITQSDATNTQYAANRDATRNILSLSESTLQSVTTLLQNVKTAAVAAGNGTLNNSDRQTIATGLSGNLQELIGLANSTDGAGNYLFSGFQSGTLPFVNVAGVMTYNGDDGQRLMQVSASRQMASTDSGADIFMRVKSGNGTFVTQPVATNTGSGVISAGTVINPAAVTGDRYSLTFSAFGTSVATGPGTINTPVVSSSAAVTGHDYSITIDAGGATYSVQDTTTNTAVAGQTNVTYTSGANITFDGIQFAITSAAAGSKFNVTAPTYSVTDVTTGAAVATAQKYTGGQAISVAGMQFDIQGIPLPNDQFTVQPSGSVSLFKTISDMISALNTPVGTGNATQGAALTASLNTAMSQLDRGLDNVLTTRSTLGLRLNEVDALQTAGSDTSIQLQQTLSQLQNVDYASALSNLTQQQMTLQAAQQSFVKVANLSLFNYL